MKSRSLRPATMSLKLRVNWPISSWDRTARGSPYSPPGHLGRFPGDPADGRDHGPHSQVDEDQTDRQTEQPAHDIVEAEVQDGRHDLLFLGMEHDGPGGPVQPVDTRLPGYGPPRCRRASSCISWSMASSRGFWVSPRQWRVSISGLVWARKCRCHSPDRPYRCGATRP